MADILGISATPRPGGNSDVMVQAILDAATPHGHSARLIHLRDLNFSSCIGCEKCRVHKRCVPLEDDMQPLYSLIDAAKGLVLVTPVHNYNMSAMLKAFLDRMYCYYDFEKGVPRPWSSRLAGQRRKAVIACIGEQAEEKDLGVTLPAMRMPMDALGYDVVGEMSGLLVFAPGKVRQREDLIGQCTTLGDKLGQALR